MEHVTLTENVTEPQTLEEKIDDVGERNSSLNLGDVFSSFKDFKLKFVAYCKEKNASFNRYDNRLVSTANFKLELDSKPYAEGLVYTMIQYTCDYHGEKHVRRFADRQCQACIRLSATKSRDELEVVLLNEEHTHATTNGGPPRARVFPMRNFARGPLPLHIYHGEGLEYPRSHIARRKKTKRGRPKGLERKSRPAYSDLLAEFQNNCNDIEPSMPNATHTDASTEQYFPPPEQSNRTENSSSVENRFQGRDTQSQNNVETDGTLPSALKNLSDLTERHSTKMNADDLFFLSMSNEIRDLPRSVKHCVKLRIMSVINNSLLEYNK